MFFPRKPFLWSEVAFLQYATNIGYRNTNAQGLRMSPTLGQQK